MRFWRQDAHGLRVSLPRAGCRARHDRSRSRDRERGLSGLPTMFVEKARDKEHARLGSSPANAFTVKIDPHLWKLMFTSACHPESVQEWLRSGCPPGMSASPTEVCGVFPATDHTSAAILGDSSRKNNCPISGRADKHRMTSIQRTQIDRIASRECFE